MTRQQSTWAGIRSELAVAAGSMVGRLSGRDSAQRLPTLEAMQYWPRDRLDAFRHQRLIELVNHARKSVPHYRDRLNDLDPGGNLAACLTSLPILSKQDLREAGRRLHATAHPRSVHTASTSGSSGSPVARW